MEPLWSAEDNPGQHMGIRRHTDRCFHAVEEEFPEGYIVQGILIPRGEVAEVSLSVDGLPACPAPVTPPRP